MAYVFKTNIANKSNYGKKRNLSSIKYIVIHYTSNDGDTDENNGKYFANNVVKTSAHYFVDDDSVTQSVPDDYVAWHCGGGLQGSSGHTFHKKCTNTNSIGIEICDDVKNGVVYPSSKTIENALELTKTLMKKYNIPVSNVIRHHDVTGKLCPAYWCGSPQKDAKWKFEFWNKLSDVEKKKGKTKVTYTSHRIPTNSWGKEIVGYNLKDNMGYSGSFGKEIDKVAIKLSEGTVTYCAHRLNGKWGNDITGYSKTDTNRYAGSTNRPIDAIVIKAEGINGKLKYRVHRKTDNKWGKWITGYSKTDTNNYAGSFGKPIDAIQIGIE